LGFGISMWEIGLILVLALVILGPRQLMDAAKVMGRLYREIQKITWDLRNSIDLDAPSQPREQPPYPASVSENDVSPGIDQDLVPSGDQKSGIDFYGDLVENSKEEVEESESADRETVIDDDQDRSEVKEATDASERKES
jgi:Sec-independent protein translocase protein TatA